MAAGPAPVASAIAGATGTITLYPHGERAEPEQQRVGGSGEPWSWACGRLSGLRARTIAELACSCTMGLADLDVGQAGVRERLLELVARERARDAAGPLLHVGAGGLVHVGVGDHVGDREAATGPQHARLGEDLALVGGEVDHAVGDHHVDGLVGSGISSM